MKSTAASDTDKTWDISVRVSETRQHPLTIILPLRGGLQKEKKKEKEERSESLLCLNPDPITTVCSHYPRGEFCAIWGKFPSLQITG